MKEFNSTNLILNLCNWLSLKESLESSTGQTKNNGMSEKIKKNKEISDEDISKKPKYHQTNSRFFYEEKSLMKRKSFTSFMKDDKK